jgi:hypothetical protein
MRSPSRAHGWKVVTINAWLTPNAPDGSIVGRVLFIPSVYLDRVNGALEQLTEDYNWEKFGTQTSTQASDVMRDMVDEYYMSNVTSDINGRVVHVPIWDFSSAPSGWDFTAVATNYCNGYWETASHLQSDFVAWQVPLNAGTWVIDGLFNRTNISGIMTWRIDGVTVGTTDLYSASSTLNTRLTTASFVVATGAMKTLSFITATKNASSGGFRHRVQDLYLRQTA